MQNQETIYVQKPCCEFNQITLCFYQTENIFEYSIMMVSYNDMLIVSTTTNSVVENILILQKNMDI